MRQNWVAPDLCMLGDTRIRFVNGDISNARTTAEEIIVLKPQSFFTQYQTLNPAAVRRIVEVGIFEGGSLVLLADMFPNAEIIGIDLRDPNPFVLRHIEALGYSDRVQVHYNVSQSDTGKINGIVEAAWSSTPIDIVIDDASHIYDLSVATFDCLFPRLTPHGHYVLEDWGWAHWPGFSGALLTTGTRTLSSMVLELTMACASYGSIVSEVRVLPSIVFVERGIAPALPLRQLVRLNGDKSWRGL